MTKPKNMYWGQPTNAPVHPYVQLEGTPLWQVVKAAIADLDGNKDIELTEWHQYVVGYICKQLSESNLVVANGLKRSSAAQQGIQPDEPASGGSAG